MKVQLQILKFDFNKKGSLKLSGCLYFISSFKVLTTGYLLTICDKSHRMYLRCEYAANQC